MRLDPRELFESVAIWADRHSPQTLFARALIIIVVPMLLLQALSAWWFYSQRGDNVTNRLAILLVRDLRMLIALRSDFPDTNIAPGSSAALPRTCCSMSASARVSSGRSRTPNTSTSPPARSRARSRPTSSATITSTTTSAAARC